jgi:hypothetical protein
MMQRIVTTRRVVGTANSQPIVLAPRRRKRKQRPPRVIQKIIYGPQNFQDGQLVSYNPVRAARNRRRREKRNRFSGLSNNPSTIVGVGDSMSMPSIATVTGAPGYDALMKSLSTIQRHGISKDGWSFLKCAFAPPDFAANDVSGVPDDFRGASLVKKHRSITPFLINASTDYYFMLSPTPGVAFWYCALAAGTVPNSSMVFNAAGYADFAQLFGPPGAGTSTSDIVTKFRFISNHFELVPTVNAMNWTGVIQAYKIPLAASYRNEATAVSTTINAVTISGLESVLGSGSANQYTAGFNMGVYTGAYNIGTQFGFKEILTNVGTVPFTVSPGSGDWGQFSSSATGCFTGLDNDFETICIKISGVGSNSLDSCLIKTWACVEYQCNPGTSIYEYQSISPCNPPAIDLYRELALALPIGVPYTENSAFWERVLKIIKMMSAAGSFIPGPIGMISTGVGSVISGIESLAL